MTRHGQITKIGKIIRHASRLRGGSGSALPGLIVEKIDPDFAARILHELPYGVVLITGTNGKTTTTKIVCSILEQHGLKVFTNRTGSNFTRGIIASLIGEITAAGVLDADIAVLELDEAYAAHFVKKIRPRYSLLLNVMRDQLDRFGEIDHTAKLLEKVAEATTTGVVLNVDDPLIAGLAEQIPGSVAVEYFGIAPSLKKLFPSDQDLYGASPTNTLLADKPPRIQLASVNDRQIRLKINGKPTEPVSLKLHGIYNMQNAAGAVCLAQMILNDKTSAASLLEALSRVKPAFGRGEALSIDGHPLEIVLVKNPAGFRLAIESYRHEPALTMIAINDNYADGRDMSWLWDVDFTSFSRIDYVTGIRAYDMALRLQYDDVEVGQVMPSLTACLLDFLNSKPAPRRIFCTYTAMMKLRKLLASRYHLEDIDK